MVKEDAVSIPPQSSAGQLYSLSKSIAAIELVYAEKDRLGLGTVMQLPFGASIEVCGEGFNDRTVKVRSNDKFYFVFVQDLAASCSERRAPGSESHTVTSRSMRAYLA